MTRTALLHLVRSQSRTFRSGARIAKVLPWSHASSAKFDASPTTRFAFSHRTWASQAAVAEDDSKISIGPRKVREDGKEQKDREVVYYGPISSTIKKVKLLSLSTCCLSISLGPVITFMTSPDMSMILKGAVASTVILLSISTTGALHWFVSPYVHKLRWQPGSDTFEAEKMSWMTTLVPKTIKFADIRPAETQRPYVSFEANGQFYFVDTEHCYNKVLVEKLTPKKQGPTSKNA